MAAMAKKPETEVAPSAETTAEAAQPAGETKTISRGPVEITFTRVAGADEEPTHYDVTLNVDGKPVQPGEASPELEHLDAHFQLGAASWLAKSLFDTLFGWIEKQPE